MRQVDGSLWLGHGGDARDWTRLHEAGIQAEVDLADSEPPLNLPRSLVALRFPLSDGGDNPPWLLLAAIRATAHLLASDVPTLVCCSAGLSRTPAIAAAAWSVVAQIEPDEALKWVTRAGPADVSPTLWTEVRAALGCCFPESEGRSVRL